MSTPPPVATHILVASDLGAASDEALLRADALARRFDARLTALHVVEPLPLVSAWGDSGSVAWMGLDALIEAGDAALRRQIERLGPRLAGPVAAECRIGSPRRDLGDLAQALGADLLVVGCRAERRLGDRLLGNTAQSAVHRARMPLLVCRRPASRRWQTVLAATDLSPTGTRVAAMAGSLAPDAVRRLLHVHPPLPEATVGLVQPDPGQLEAYALEAERAAAARFDAEAKRTEGWIATFRRGAVIDTVLAEAQARAVDLIVMGTHGHGPWVGGLLGSVSQAVVAGADADVLLVPARD